MSRFLNDTLTDIRGGRESWRVFVAVCAPSFIVAVVFAALQRLS